MNEFTLKLIGGLNTLIQKYYVIIIFLLLSILTISTHKFVGFPKGHSAVYNIFWQKYFTEQLLAGEFFPRWLYNYIDGFGAPVFYFYAPLPFYLFSLIEIVFGNDGGNFSTLSIGHIMILFFSGITFYILISRFINKFWATSTSILYMFLPYHYIDLEVRAAIGESFAYIWIPLIMIGIINFGKKQNQILFSGFCYAGLILSHLPSALLTAPIIAIFFVCIVKPIQRLRAIVYAFFIGFVGIAISAFYIIPALSLQSTLPHDAWITSAGYHFQAINWLLGNLGIPMFGLTVYIILCITSLLSIGTIFIFLIMNIKTKQQIDFNNITWRLITASIISLVFCWFLMTNLARYIWIYFPFVAQVQFPWRLGIIIDFCAALLIGLVAPRVLRSFLSIFPIKRLHIQIFERIIVIIFLTVVIFLAIIVFFPQTIAGSRENILQYNPTEYRPKWLVESTIYLSNENIDNLSDIKLANQIHRDGIERWESFVKTLPPIEPMRALKSDENIHIYDEEILNSTIIAKLRSPASIRVNKVYYPHWILINNSGKKIDIYPDTKTGLILFDLPSGEYELILKRQVLPSEWVGFIISLVSIIASILWITVFNNCKIK